MIENHDSDHDNGGTRTGYQRRRNIDPDLDIDRRLEKDRRTGLDRRSDIGRKRHLERRDIFNGIDE